jgi:hypothetical protein
MIVYNVTVKVELGINDVWVQWMKHDHCPKILATGCFHDYKMFRVMEDDQSDGMTYAVQFYAHSIGDYFTFQNIHYRGLQAEMKDTFQDKCMSFRTVLREV